MLSIERQFIRTERPHYSLLVSLLESAIAKGDLPSGARVPPERVLAQQLKISRTTVVSAYRELESRGLLRGYVGRGTFVSAKPDTASAPFAWRGKIAAAALLEAHAPRRRPSLVDARLLSLAAGEPALDSFRPRPSRGGGTPVERSPRCGARAGRAAGAERDRGAL
jgi:DNA-binding GntR family transcriptional regulator